LNADQIARIEEAEAFALSPFGKAGNQEPGNPLGSNGRFFGAGYVMVHSECHTSLLNRAVAIEEVHLNEATRYFEEFGIPPRFDLAPALRSPGWNAWMEEHEFEIESYPMMGRRIVAGPAVHTALSTGMDIRAIQDNDLDSLIDHGVRVQHELPPPSYRSRLGASVGGGTEYLFLPSMGRG